MECDPDLLVAGGLHASQPSPEAFAAGHHCFSEDLRPSHCGSVRPWPASAFEDRDAQCAAEQARDEEDEVEGGGVGHQAAAASRGYRSGLRSWRLTPVSASVFRTYSAGKGLPCFSHAQTVG